MANTKFALLTSTLLGLVLGALILTVAMLTPVQAEPADAFITIAKEPDQTAVSGSAATFTITVNNTGLITLTNVTVSDPLAPDCDRAVGDLDLGANYVYTCTLPNVTVDLTNQITVTGVWTGTNQVPVSDTATADVDVINPAVEIAKTPDTQTLVSGSDANFTIAITNTGDVTLTGVVVEDLLAPACDTGPLTLNVSQSASYTCTLANVTIDLTNRATVTGTPPIGEDVASSDTADVNVIAPDIAIAKTPDKQVVASGSTATFTIAITNTGDANLTNVQVSDPTAPDCYFGPTTLNVGQSTSYTCNAFNVTDGFINVASVSGMSPASEEVSALDSAIVNLNETLSCPADMAAYWKLDETSGATYDDYYNGLDGACDGQCPSPTTGRVNGGQAFNGSTTGISVPTVVGHDALNWGASDSFSIEFWMRADHPNACSGNNQVVVGRDDGSTQLHWWAGCWSSGEAAFVLIDQNGNRSDQLLHGTTDLSGDANWHHVVAVRDASADLIRLYVDGVEEASSPATGYGSFASSVAALNIGWINLSDGYHFAGTVDEVAVYDRALDAVEVERHYQEGELAGRWYCQDSAFSPTIFSTPTTAAQVQQTYAYDVDAIGNPAPTYTLTISSTGMTIDPATGLLSWLPVVAQQGSHPVQVQAINSQGTDTQDFTINVAEGPLCPVDMISYWKLDESSGTTYADFYDGNTGACQMGQCPSPVAGQVNGGQTFDGSDEVDVPADDSFDWGASDSFSIEFWLRTDASSTCSGNQVVVGREDDSTSLHWWVGCQAGGSAGFVLRDRDGTSQQLYSTTDVTDGLWHHIVAVRDASSTTNRLYVDGTEEVSATLTYTAGFDSLIADLNVGWLDRTGGFHFVGTVDEIALYDKALDTAEIQQHLDRGVAGASVCYSPDIAIAKTPHAPTVYAGELVTYTYTVTNPGDDPLSNLSIRDDRCSPVTHLSGDVNTNDELDPVETWTYACSMNLSADTLNTAFVTGTHSLNDVVSDTTSVFVDVIDPHITIAKTANPTTTQTGGLVTYTYTVNNPGDDPLSNTSVSDDRCSPVVYVTGDTNLDLKVDPSETWTYTCAMSLSEDTTNTALVTGTDSLSGIITDTATAFVQVIPPGYKLYLPLVLRNH